MIDLKHNIYIEILKNRACYYLPLIISIIGSYLRLFFYLQNRSLWADEAKLALNIIELPILELIFSPLRYGQVAPVGFLLIEKLSLFLFGSSELSLRLWPLIFSIASIFLLWKILILLKTEFYTKIIILSLFSFAPYLIRFSSELKQYSVDVFACLIIIYASILYTENRKMNKALFLGAVLLIIPLFSQTAVFLLPGCILSIIFHKGFKKGLLNDKEFRLILIMATIGFILFGLFSLRDSSSSYEFMADYWENGFLIFPPQNITHIIHNIIILLTLLAHPFALTGYSQILLGLITLIIGSAFLLRHNLKYAILLITPIIMLFFASALRLYPIGGEPTIIAGRLVLFTHPILSIIIGFGCFNHWMNIRSITRIFGLIAAFLIVFFTFSRIPEYTEISLLNVRQTVNYLQDNIEPDDDIYTTGLIWSPVKYYLYRYGMHDFHSLGFDIPSEPAERTSWLIHYYGDTEMALVSAQILGTIEEHTEFDAVGIFKISPP